MGLWAYGKSFLRLYYSLIICSRLLARTYGVGRATQAGRQVGKRLPRWLVWMVRCRTILLCSPASILKDHEHNQLQEEIEHRDGQGGGLPPGKWLACYSVITGIMPGNCNSEYVNECHGSIMLISSE